MAMIVRNAFKNENGFTLLEIILVLLLLGILALVAISRSVNYHGEVYAGADVLKTHLRYAQTMAMNSALNSGPTVWGVRGTTTNYWLFQGTDPAAAVNHVALPEDETFVSSDKTVNLTAKKIKLATVFTIYFDKRGVPYTAYTNTMVNTPLSNALNINLKPLDAATPAVAVTVIPRTGYIP